MKLTEFNEKCAYLLPVFESWYECCFAEPFDCFNSDHMDIAYWWTRGADGGSMDDEESPHTIHGAVWAAGYAYWKALHPDHHEDT